MLTLATADDTQRLTVIRKHFNALWAVTHSAAGRRLLASLDTEIRRNGLKEERP